MLRTRMACWVVAMGLMGAAVAQGVQDKAKAGGAAPFGDLVGELKKTEGCLGVELVSTQSGKQAIFAWFDDRAAVLRCYDSPSHRGVMDRFCPDRPPHRPLADIPDGTGPILAIASITPQATPNPELGGIPVSQISIELLTPLPGGLDFGGTFAPAGAKARKPPAAAPAK